MNAQNPNDAAIPTQYRTLDELLAYLADLPGPSSQRDLPGAVIRAHAAGLLTAGEFEAVVGHIADDMEARGERAGPRLWPGPEADDNRGAGG